MSDTGLGAAALADLQWLRRFAEILVRDADDVDDLVQETLVAAWSSRLTDDGRSARPWLSSVLRNRFRMLQRSRSRRDAREQLDVDGGLRASSEPEQEIARLEVLQALLAALEALPVDDQRLVIRRFFDGESAADISNALEIPAATVRSRIHRTLGRLREALDRRFSGREAWSMVLAAPVPAADFGSAASPPAGKGASMSVTMKVALCTSLVAAGGILAWAIRDGAVETGTIAAADDGNEASPIPVATTPTNDGEADAATAKAEWEQRRRRIRAELATSRPNDPDGRLSEVDHRKSFNFDAFRALVDACLDDLGREASGALTLEMVELGAPDVGVVYESVEVLESTVDDDEVLRCIVESMHGYIGEAPPETYERKRTITTAIGKSDHGEAGILRIFDAVIGAHINEVRFCESKGNAASGLVTGSVAIEITIAGDGTVAASNAGATMLLPTVVDCIVTATKRWKFPAKLAGRTLSYEFVLPVGVGRRDSPQ